MTLQVTITVNDDGDPPNKVDVNVWEKVTRLGGTGIEIVPPQESCQLSSGETVTVTLLANRGVTLVQHPVDTPGGG